MDPKPPSRKTRPKHHQITRTENVDRTLVSSTLHLKVFGPRFRSMRKAGEVSDSGPWVKSLGSTGQKFSVHRSKVFGPSSKSFRSIKKRFRSTRRCLDEKLSVHHEDRPKTRSRPPKTTPRLPQDRLYRHMTATRPPQDT
jgi:hypothetical protein